MNTRHRLCGTVLLATCGLACDPDSALSLAPDMQGPEGPTEASQQAVTSGSMVPMTPPTLAKTYVDCSGHVWSKMWFCDSTVARDLETGTCPVGDSNYVAVGGGAQALGGESYPGAFLIDGSVRSANRDSFQASSKAHAISQPHKLRVYVVGLMISGVSRAQLLANIDETSYTSIRGSTPSATRDVPPGRILLGGYVFSPWFEGATPGQLLVGSWGSPAVGRWQVQTMAHMQPDPLSVTVRLVHIAPSIAGISLESVEAGATVYNSSGLGQATVTFPRAALTAIGGWSSFEKSQGRALVRMGPLNHTPLDYRVVVSSKDHVSADSGTTWVNAVGIRQKPTEPYTRCFAQVL
jgi:hypothetical protein